jgi:hypothetical protein
VVIDQIVQPQGDFAALAWLTASAALASAARRSPLLLAPAIAAAGLAVGVKTTAAPLAAVAIGAGAWSVRGSLRPLVRPLIACLAAAVAVGGVWYVRNLVEHGSPLWPLATTSWGDPVPPLISKLDYSLLERPAATLRVHGLTSTYRDQFAGALLVVAAALLAPLWVRTRAVLAAAGATLFALVLWANAPFTGVGHVAALAFWPLGTLRYALPVIAAGALTLAIAARTGTERDLLPMALLTGATGFSLSRYAADPFLPSEASLALGMGVGVAGGALAAPLFADRRRWPAVAVALAAAAGGLAIGASGYVLRHTHAPSFDRELARWFQTQRDWRRGKRPVAVSPTVFATLAGDRLRHPLSLIDAHDSCAAIARRERAGWVVVGRAAPELFPPVSVGRCLARQRPLATPGGYRVYTAP